MCFHVSHSISGLIRHTNVKIDFAILIQIELVNHSLSIKRSGIDQLITPLPINQTLLLTALLRPAIRPAP